MNNRQINFNPTKEELEQVKKWLEEDAEHGEGFFENWKMIEEAYYEKRFISLVLAKKTVGFYIWRKNKICLEIDIFVIYSKCIREGLGEYLLKNTIDHFKKQDIKIFKLFCRPSESEKFWKKMGFLVFPKSVRGQLDLTLYKPLVDIKDVVEGSNELNRLELSNCEGDKWVWAVEGGALSKPIIQPADVDWILRWFKNGKIFKEEQIKYFSESDKIFFSPFIFIENLS